MAIAAERRLDRLLAVRTLLNQVSYVRFGTNRGIFPILQSEQLV
jgi:hypothetical protein